MKRLHDDQVKTLWDSERMGGPTADPGPLEADHLQAREDVKRLVMRLRGRVQSCERDVSDVRRKDLSIAADDLCQCGSCRCDRALLSEVGQ